MLSQAGHERMSEDPGYGGRGQGVRPTMDLSHLTPEERSIIEGVMHKQQMEENKEIRFLKVTRPGFDKVKPKGWISL